MRFLITRDFFKNVPKEKMKQVKNRIKYFYNEISKNKKTIFETPKGFWVKKIRENLFEFRVNSGDRVMFEFRKTARPGEGSEYDGKELVLLSFDKHDIVIKNAIRGNRETETSISDFDLNKIEDEDERNLIKGIKEFDLNITQDKKSLDKLGYIETDKRTTEDINKIYNKINSKIVYEVTSDKDLQELIENQDEYAYYYLNDEQYDILNEELPLFLKGSAGSGKTTVAIRKALELEEWAGEKVGYVTFTHSLKEKAQDMYRKFRDDENEKLVEFYSLEELYEGLLKEKPKGYKAFDDFLYEYNPTMPKGIEVIELYQEIRGIIKGSMGANGSGNWDRDLNNPLIKKDDYLSLNKKNTIYSKEEREKIYKLAETYQNWLEEKNYLDENDLARQVILQKKEMFDTVICDEVQDLTEVEIFMLRKLVKNRSNLFLAGDIHQIINPTYFKFSRVKSLFYTDKYSERILQKNYRSQKKIVDLANKLSNLRGEYIGKLGEDYKEASILDGEDIYICEKDIPFLKQLEDNVTIILVPTSEMKSAMRKKYKNIENKILTVQDIKGLEFDSVILYNFGVEFSKYWKVIFAKEAKSNQMYRYYFNLLYVGLTRAKKKLLFMEEKKENILIDYLKDYLLDLTIEAKNQFILKSGQEDFLKEGKEFMKRNLFQEAISSFSKAKAFKYIEEAKSRLEAYNYFEENGEKESIKYIVSNDNLISKYLEGHVVLDRIGDYAFQNKDYKKAEKYYKRSKNYEKLCEIYELEGKLEAALETSKLIEDKGVFNELKQKLALNNKALKYAKDIIKSSDKKIYEKNYSLLEFENLNRKYIISKEVKNLGEIFAILNTRLNTLIKSDKNYKVKSPTKLLIKLTYIEGGEKGIEYLLENNINELNIKSIISNLDNPKLLEKYMSKIKKKSKVDLDELLILAVEKDKTKNALKLIQLGGDLKVKSKNKLNLLQMAIKKSNFELVKILVEKQINLNLDEDNSILTEVINAKEFSYEIFSYLVEKVDLNCGNPIYHSILKGNVEAIKLLISKGTDLSHKENKKRESLILNAIDCREYEIIKLLIDGGIDLHHELDKNLITPIKAVIYKKDEKAMRIFLEKNYKFSQDEIEFLSKRGTFKLVELFLEFYLGENYKEVIKSSVDSIKSNRDWKKPLKLKEKVSHQYDFMKYRKVKEEKEEKEERNGKS